ncbi:DUF4439 domain-containing protein [Nigerium massiliense]|uniref:DUF4439 domain-containing protein n=1 Tax=Nigerium massiliense TaxID=1522317 RepID=UPI00058D4296|nr:DUF4439 domain-containing protein [Nigerium massiliense]
MATWCRLAAVAVVAGNVRVQQEGAAQLPASAAPIDAANDALAACHAVIYGLPVTLATPGWTPPDRAAVLGRLAAWRVLRDTLVDAVTAIPGTPIAALASYDIQPPGTPAAARAEVGRLQAAALPHLAVAIQSGPASARPALVSVLGTATYDLTRWGTPIPRWPGLS